MMRISIICDSKKQGKVIEDNLFSTLLFATEMDYDWQLKYGFPLSGCETIVSLSRNPLCGSFDIYLLCTSRERAKRAVLKHDINVIDWSNSVMCVLHEHVTADMLYEVCKLFGLTSIKWETFTDDFNKYKTKISCKCDM